MIPEVTSKVRIPIQETLRKENPNPDNGNTDLQSVVDPQHKTIVFPKLTKEQHFVYSVLRPIYLASHNVKSPALQIQGPFEETYSNNEAGIYQGGFKDGRKLGFGKMVK